MRGAIECDAPCANLPKTDLHAECNTKFCITPLLIGLRARSPDQLAPAF